MNWVLAVPVIELTARREPLVDAAAPDDRFAVAQVKSGTTPVNLETVAATLGAAAVPGGRSRVHAWLYSEAGYAENVLYWAELHGMFLWTIDKRGWVRPWSWAAMWANSPELQCALHPGMRTASVSAAEVLRLTDRNRSDSAYEAGVLKFLDACAQQGRTDRAQARQALLRAVEAEWQRAGVPDGRFGKLRPQLTRALIEGELTWGGGASAERIHSAMRGVAVRVVADGDTGPQAIPAVSKALRLEALRSAKQRLLRISREALISDDDGPPILLTRMAESALADQRWIQPEVLWRDFLLRWDRGER
jgi:hypothetical protein